MSDTVIIIPARYGSTRLQAKALLSIDGVTLVEQVWRRAIAVPNADVIVATDHEKIAETVINFGGTAVYTQTSCASGSDRVAEAVAKLSRTYDNIINVQGDLPFINPSEIRATLIPLTLGFDVGTLVACMPESKQKNPSFVKAVVSTEQSSEVMQCHWFCRAALPYGHHHLGVYAYKRAALYKYAQTLPHPLEQQESLEQLRFLTKGYRIGAILVSTLALEVNTDDDLQHAREYAKQQAYLV